MKLFSYRAVAALAALPGVAGHGYMIEPASRNYYAHTDGIEGAAAGVPPRAYCHHCLNSNSNICGISQSGRNFDEWNDSLGQPMPWITQQTYSKGQIIRVTSTLATVSCNRPPARRSAAHRSATPIMCLTIDLPPSPEPQWPHGAPWLSQRQGIDASLLRQSHPHVCAGPVLRHAIR